MAMYVDLWQNIYLACVRLWAPSLILETKKNEIKERKELYYKKRTEGPILQITWFKFYQV